MATSFRYRKHGFFMGKRQKFAECRANSFPLRTFRRFCGLFARFKRLLSESGSDRHTPVFFYATKTPRNAAFSSCFHYSVFSLFSCAGASSVASSATGSSVASSFTSSVAGAASAASPKGSAAGSSCLASTIWYIACLSIVI